MTEAEWLACTDPRPMLQFLRERADDKDDRKSRLFACACCRTTSVWQSARDERSRTAVEVAERFADGKATPEELHAAQLAARAASERFTDDFDNFDNTHYDPALLACKFATDSSATDSADLCAYHAFGFRVPHRRWEYVVGAFLLREVFGNPFRPSPPLPAAVLAWNDGTVVRIAQAIYDERRLPEGTLDTSRLAILADALLDAGCDDEVLLAHCRGARMHVRGCWAVDLILGKS